ncbi:MAG: hypothetical protein RI897_2354 [Verrucomicrobiota bacterium]
MGDIDGHAGPGELGEELGVPVGEAEATEGFGFADAFGVGGAVDPVAGSVEPDPDEADGVIGTGWDGEVLFDLADFGGLAEAGGDEEVFGFVGDGCNLEAADEAVLDFAGDGAGEERDAVGDGVEDLEYTGVEVDLDGGGFSADGGGADAGDGEGGAGVEVAPVEVLVELADEVGVGVGAFGDHFDQRFELEAGCVGFADPGGGDGGEALEVLGGDGEAGERGFSEQEVRFGGEVELPGFGDVLELLESLDGASGFGAIEAVDGAAAEAESAEGDLGFENSIDRAGGPGVGGGGGDDEAGIGFEGG